MSDDHIIPERDYHRKRKLSHPTLSGWAWVKGDFDFWRRRNIVYDDGRNVTVSLDNMEEMTVDRTDVDQFDLERGDLVFVQHWPGSLSGFPALIVAVKAESADVGYPIFWAGGSHPHKHLLSDLRIYAGVKPTNWQVGSRVFAYKAVQFTPDLFLHFPAIVRSNVHQYCVHVEFHDGGTDFVPTTLVQNPEIHYGDTVYTCISYISHGTNPDERWGPCRVVENRGHTLLLQDEVGERFEAPFQMIAVLPKGYRMNDGELEKISSAPTTAPMDVFVVRTEDWRNADEDPITKADVGRLIGMDDEIAWAAPDQDKFSNDKRIVDRGAAILWKGVPSFWWCGNAIRCTMPDQNTLAKLIDMAIELDANVIGADGKEYH